MDTGGFDGAVGVPGAADGGVCVSPSGFRVFGDGSGGASAIVATDRSMR